MIIKTRYLVGLTFSLMSVLIGHASEVQPDFYTEPGLHPNRDYVNQHVAEHIDPFSGGLQLHYIDIFIPGNGGMDLKVQRSYNSAVGSPFANWSINNATAGVGWNVNFGRVLKSKDSNVCSRTFLTAVGENPVLELPDGSRQILYDAWVVDTSGPQYLTANRWKADCIGPGGLAVTSPEGTRYDMTVPGVEDALSPNPSYSWFVSKMTDRNDNTITFTYSTASGFPF